MPRFSVTVPAYQVQAYPCECRDAVLYPSYPDLELIAVDERSPDVCDHLVFLDGADTETVAWNGAWTGAWTGSWPGARTGGWTGAWNMAYRREFVEGAGFALPPGHCEDTPRTHPVLMTAESVATVDRMCPHCRQRPRSGIPGTAGRRHVDVFERHDGVCAYADEHPEPDCRRRELFRRMVDHLATGFARRDRLPRAARAGFLRTARAQCRRHRVPGLTVPVRALLRHTLVHLGLRRAFRALRQAAVLGRRGVKVLVRLLRATRSAALRLHHHVQLRPLLRADRAVFAAHGGRGHGCDPGAPETGFRAHAPGIRTAGAACPGHRHTSRVPFTPGRPRTGRRLPAPTTW